jgi:two-component system osmolarity sensor histidine kinase EnvZ
MSFDWLKSYMPRSLYGRAALILLLPVIFLQLVVSVVFTQRHFEDVTHQMSDTMARELRMVIAALEAGQDMQAFAPLRMTITSVDAALLEAADARDWDDFSGVFITARLKLRVPEVKVVDLTPHRSVRVVMETRAGPYEVTFNRRRISAANPHQLFVNMVFFSILVTVVALVYLRNQLRPIKRLATAAEAFGRGRHVPYSPAGATEVRAAGAAFIDMRGRIERQIETRTLMLSAVSHDLRTPLTRMRLGLSMMDSDEVEPLLQDVEEMSGMIDAFLDFSKGTAEGAPEAVDPVQLTREAVNDATRAGLDVSLHEVAGTGQVMLRPAAIRRALDNLITNAVRYGGRADVSVTLTEKSVRFRVEDAGPGIPEGQREEAVKPFARLDPARNQDKGSSVGLGLAIATDIARAHGGVLRLGSSERLGGLQADIVIAR